MPTPPIKPVRKVSQGMKKVSLKKSIRSVIVGMVITTATIKIRKDFWLTIEASIF